ncbi:uncharacterized protein MYCGRDRAFT_103523 [Zymoseptoria tritici IPO323]|uniref:SRR1-like domain-containing protein n=1 Tax=Zymoseptoria tritici (strain CBS 115943 / IPO323) TaxID=336722 RepID=F9X770_ZYMTI|nr:uncharacterized protein MYCGRDRAFT_103523 [Zymoseptoria tritici IPO323]EGP89657.1 hypothetical protein MYCGRDRAFT_103523 [Zymoseptoria tritici IPO323]
MATTLTPDASWNHICPCAEVLGPESQEGGRWNTPDFLATATALYAEQQQRWLATETRRDLIAILNFKAPPGGFSIRNAVLMAIGEIFHDDPKTFKKLPHQLFQLAVFQDIVAHLQSRLPEGQEIVISVQDPALTEYSKMFLTSLGFLILDAEQFEGESAIQFDTFSFAPFYNWQFTFLGRCRLRQPALHIGAEQSSKIARDAFCFKQQYSGVQWDECSHDARACWTVWAYLKTFWQTHEHVRICDSERKVNEAWGIHDLFLSVERPGASCAKVHAEQVRLSEERKASAL